jgi:macrolide-specific efflux system membrane fusion protein
MPESTRRPARAGALTVSSGSQRGYGGTDLAKIFLGFTAALGLASGGVAAWNGATSKEPARDLLSTAVTRGSVEDTISALGSIQPREFVDVGTQVSGQLRRLLVNVGDQVKAGALIAEIDPAVFSARVDAGRATLANLAAQLDEKRAQHSLAIAQHERNLKMFKQDAVSRDAVEISQATTRIAAAQVAGLLAQADQTRATMRVDEANLAYTRIVAPMSGTVVSLAVRQGQTVNASQQAPVILRLANLDTMTVVTQVSEADVVRLHVGMELYFSTLGTPQRRWPGRVRQILPMPETLNNVVLYSVLFDVDNKGQELKAQMSAQVSFVAAQAKGTLVVPVSALQRHARKAASTDEPAGTGESNPDRADDGTPGVAVTSATGSSPNESKGRRASGYAVLVLKEGRVEERRVRVGVANRIQAQVLSGLAEGEQVVVEAAASGGRSKDAARRGTKS